MKRIILYFLLVFATGISLVAQNLLHVRATELPEVPVAFSVDLMGAVYVVFENGSLIKYDTTGNAISNAGRKTKSSEWQIDASNPYKIIVFNRDLQVADIYNAQLSSINSIDFTLLETGDISLLCNSYDNAFWTLASSNLELVRYSEQLTITSKTNIGLNSNTTEFIPDIMMESDSRLLIAQKNGSARVFDLYGNIQLQYPDTAESWSLDNGVLFFLEKNQISAFQLQLKNLFVLENTGKKISDFAIRSQWLVCTNEKTIDLYKFISAPQ